MPRTPAPSKKWAGRARRASVGRAGRVLDVLLVQHGMGRNRDYGVANIVRCRPENNRKPDWQEITNCLPRLVVFLLEWRPAVLLLVGATATEAFLGPGPLLWQIERSRRSPVLLAKGAHQSLRPAIRKLHTLNGGVYAVPMPHTSGMAWNRKAPNGKAWREIGKDQVQLAVECMRSLYRPRLSGHGFTPNSCPEKSAPAYFDLAVDGAKCSRMLTHQPVNQNCTSNLNPRENKLSVASIQMESVHRQSLSREPPVALARPLNDRIPPGNHLRTYQFAHPVLHRNKLKTDSF
ncbi:MAG: uracil-DNA glycosylase family protein [Pseudomonadota bacterium]